MTMEGISMASEDRSQRSRYGDGRCPCCGERLVDAYCPNALSCEEMSPGCPMPPLPTGAIR